MDTFVDPDLQGCAMNARAAAEPIVRKIEFDGDDWLFFPTIVPDVAIIRATTADERGNLTLRARGRLSRCRSTRRWRSATMAASSSPRSSGWSRPARSSRSRSTCPACWSTVIVVAPDQMQTTQTAYDPAISGEICPRRRQLPADALGRRQGDRPPRRAGTARRLGGQSRLRHLGARAARPARGGPPRRGHLGDRAGCGRRRAAARLPVRLLGQRRGDHALAAAVHLLPGRRLRLLAAVVHADRPGRQRQRLAAGGQAARDRRLRRLRRHHRPRPARSCSAATSPPAPSCESRTGGCTSQPRARSRSSSPEVEHVSFSGRRGIEQGQDVTYVTERCVMRAAARRDHGHRDWRPGSISGATCWSRRRSSSRSPRTCARWTPRCSDPSRWACAWRMSEHV